MNTNVNPSVSSLHEVPATLWHNSCVCVSILLIVVCAKGTPLRLVQCTTCFTVFLATLSDSHRNNSPAPI